ncbi:MAG: ATP-binding cassette domain-containing protein [Actinobacteria bacterium]|nr:ATP-binding cassette domain-containing protein [Actinomycetota bacterium]
MNASQKAVLVEGLVKRYGGLEAVSGISFEVEQGELFGFLGPNGAGKTTTVSILTGVTAPSGGKASVFGHDVVKDSFRAKELMGIVPEVSNAYMEYSALNNLIFTGALYGVPKKTAAGKAEELLKRFDLHKQKNVRAGKFSQGMKRKLVIAMALINDPPLLFMDEPTTGLDVQSVLGIREMVRGLNGKGITVFLTTHNLVEANLLCDRIAIVDKGKIVAIDTPEKLKAMAESVQVVDVAFDRQLPGADGELASIGSVGKVDRHGDKYHLLTDDPSHVVKEISHFAERNELGITYISTPGPSLEDVFIKLTGIDGGGPE